MRSYSLWHFLSLILSPTLLSLYNLRIIELTYIIVSNQLV